MKNILIIGGAGYIGSHQVKMMCDREYNVIVLDNLNTGFESSVDKRAKLYIGDMRDFQMLKDILVNEKIDGVMHFAALSLVGESVHKPLEYYDNNLYGMQILLKAMTEADVKTIVFSSTAATYGMHDVMPIDETYATNPVNPYGETKLAMEKMMKWVDNARGIKFVSLRYFNAAGADDSGVIGELHDPETHLIPLVLQVALGQRENITIFGDDYQTPDGTCIRDYIHVNDLAQAHVLAIDYLLAGGESQIFNLGYGNGYSVKEIIDVARNVTGHEIPAVVEARRAGDPALLIASSEKIKEVLNWEPKHNDINYIIQSAYNFHKNNINK